MKDNKTNPDEPQGDFAYLEKAKLVATDAQLSGDVGVIARLLQEIARLQQERDQARAELTELATRFNNPEIHEQLKVIAELKEYEDEQ
jgi:hypothetical protein